MTPRRISVVVLLLALVGVGAWQGKAVWWWATTTVSYESLGGLPNIPQPVIRQLRWKRWRDDNPWPQLTWYRDTGLLAVRHRSYGFGGMTIWNYDGTVKAQVIDWGQNRTESPWLPGYSLASPSTNGGVVCPPT